MTPEQQDAVSSAKALRKLIGDYGRRGVSESDLDRVRLLGAIEAAQAEVARLAAANAELAGAVIWGDSTLEDAGRYRELESRVVFGYPSSEGSSCLDVYVVATGFKVESLQALRAYLDAARLSVK